METKGGSAPTMYLIQWEASSLSQMLILTKSVICLLIKLILNDACDDMVEQFKSKCHEV